MTCAAQAADLLVPLAVNGKTILDVGCGSGYFFHSLKNRNIPLEYYGVDATASLIKIGQEELPSLMDYQLIIYNLLKLKI